MPRPAGGPQLRPNQKRQGAYYIYWTEDGRSRERSTGTRDRAQAHQIFADWLASRTEPLRWDGPRRAAQTSIADVLALYAEKRAPETTSPKTIGYAVKALLGWWDEQMVDAVKPETCQAYVRARAAAVRKNQTTGIAAATASRELTVLRAAIGWAHKNGYLVEKPFVELPARPPGRDRWLSRSEAARLLWESRRDPQASGHLPMFILLALTTGARPSALFDLRWTQIDFDHDRIDFNPPGRKRTSKGRPVISIPRRLRWFLLKMHARATSPYVLSYNGKKLASVKKSFRAARTRARLGKDVVPYTLRHTCACWMAQQGVPLWQIGGWLGHSQSRTTELYAHHHPAHLEQARKVMD